MEARITLEDVWFGYDKEPVLKGVSLGLVGGRVYGLAGPNASGKTTLLKLVSLLLRPVKGRVLVDGVDPWAGGVEGFRGRIVYVHERPIVLRGLVYDNIAVGLELQGLGKEAIRERVLEVAEKLMLRGILWEKMSKLSTGQVQLVAIARALAVDPVVLALDESFSNLDSGKRRVVARAIKELANKGGIAIVSSHDPLLLSKISDEVIYLEDGAVKFHVDAESFLDKLSRVV
ncbi:MAG: ABC transporter ATP-binding protein [Desulfurococcales archaeon]|nr:ABC transporter ATP-binding protein [Desulfurococcales archaeon]